MFPFFSTSAESDFVSRVKYYKPKYTPGKPESDFTPEDMAVYQLITQVLKPMVEATEYIKQVTEVIFVDIIDRANMHLTVRVKDGLTQVSVGWDKDVFPTIVIPVTSSNMQYFEEILKDGQISPSELQRIIHILTIPALKAFYHSEMLNKLQDVSILKLHKLVHVQVTNPEKTTMGDGTLIDTKATIMSVMGQFIILPGHVGTAPIIFQVTTTQALAYYKLLRYDLPNATGLMQKKALFDKYMELRQSTVLTNPDY
jgi:hypothetical protein